MITQSYEDQNRYTGSVEVSSSIPQTTPASGSAREKAKYTLKPGDPEDLRVQSNDEYQYDSAHTSSRSNSRPEQGWTERERVGSPMSGGMVRNPLLSGSYGELKKLRVDSEVNSETVTTSWSASIGENLKVGRNAGVAGYVNIGKPDSLVTSSDSFPKRTDPQPDFAPNSEGITGTGDLAGKSDLRLLVSNSALVQDRFYVGKSASVSGGLDVKEDVRIARNLYVTGNTQITGNNNVSGNEAVSGSLHVIKTIHGSEDFRLTGSAHITKSLFVKEDAAVTGSLHVLTSGSIQELEVTKSARIGENLGVSGDSYLSGSLYVKENAVVTQSLFVNGNAFVTGDLHNDSNLYVAGNAKISGNVEISESAAISGSLSVTHSVYVSGNLYVSGDTVLTSSLEVVGPVTIHGESTYGGDAHFLESVVIDKNLTVHGTTTTLDTEELKVKDKSITIAMSASTPEQANGAGIDIAGADVHFHYTSSTDRMGLNKGLDVWGDENVKGDLDVSENFYLNQGTAHISNSILTQSLVLTQSVSHSTVLSQSVTTQSVNLQHVVSSSVEQLNVKSGSMKDLQLVSGNAGYLKAEKLEVTSTDPAEFRGDVVVQGNVSCSHSGSFRDIEVENNANVGNTASVGHFLEITNNDGEGSSVVINTGSIEARQSDVYFHNISASGHISGSTVSASTYYGYGGNLIGVTASAASSSTWKSYLDFEAGATQRVTHPFNTTDVFVQVYRWDDPNFHPDLAHPGESFRSPATRVNDATVKIIGNGIVDISNTSAVNGYAVISDAGMIITASVDLLQVAADYAEYEVPVGNEKTIYRFEHKLGTQNLIVNVYQRVDIKDGYGTIKPVQIFPEQVVIYDNSHVDIVFGKGGINGYVVLGKAGHVIKQFDIGDFIDEYNIHWGTNGRWQAAEFTAVTVSADMVYAGEAVDAHIVGNRDSGPQYYQSRSWGSYTEYTDTGINEWVRYSPDDDADIRQVSNIDKEGNLTIRGRIITNGSFTTSDIRQKDVTGKIENALEGIEKINGVRFNWKESGEPSIGVIAQEINAIYPELTKVVPGLDGKDRMTVNYEGIIGVLVEAVKELSSKVKNLEDKLENENR